MRNERRNWGNNDRAANQYQPRIIFRNPGSWTENNQGNQNPQDKGNGKAAANDDGSDPKGPCQICWKWGIQLQSVGLGSKRIMCPSQTWEKRQRGAYIASADGQSSRAWYLDNGALHESMLNLTTIGFYSSHWRRIQFSYGVLIDSTKITYKWRSGMHAR